MSTTVIRTRQEVIADMAMVHLRASGPVSFRSILSYCKQQCNMPDEGHLKGAFPQDYEVAAVITGLIRAGAAVLYDTGDAFDATHAPPPMEEYGLIRPEIMAALKAWADDRQPPGGFLQHVIANDLGMAIHRGDSGNLQAANAA